MAHTFKTGLLFAIVMMSATAVIAGEEAAEAEKEWSFELDLTWNSKYIWRGINLTDDPVLQPSATFNYKGFSANIWGNADMTGVNNNDSEFNEVDYTVSYSWEWRKLDLSLGAIYYDFPNTHAEETTELFASVGIDVPLSPSITFYQDINEIDGWYSTFSVGHTFEDVLKFTDDVSMSVDISGSIGYASANFNKGYFGVEDTTAVDATLSLSTPITLSESLTLTPSINYSELLDDKIIDGTQDETNWWGGVSLTYSF